MNGKHFACTLYCFDQYSTRWFSFSFKIKCNFIFIFINEFRYRYMNETEIFSEKLKFKNPTLNTSYPKIKQTCEREWCVQVKAFFADFSYFYIFLILYVVPFRFFFLFTDKFSFIVLFINNSFFLFFYFICYWIYLYVRRSFIWIVCYSTKTARFFNFTLAYVSKCSIDFYDFVLLRILCTQSR